MITESSHVQIKKRQAHKHTSSYTCKRARTSTNTNISTHIRTHKHTYTHAHTIRAQVRIPCAHKNANFSFVFSQIRGVDIFMCVRHFLCIVHVHSAQRENELVLIDLETIREIKPCVLWGDFFSSLFVVIFLKPLLCLFGGISFNKLKNLYFLYHIAASIKTLAPLHEFMCLHTTTSKRCPKLSVWSTSCAANCSAR